MVECMLCGATYRAISCTHLKRHGTTFKDYIKRFPDAKTTWNDGAVVSPKELEKRKISRRNYIREYRKDPVVRDRINKNKRLWRQRPDVKERLRLKSTSPEGRKASRERARRRRKNKPEEVRAYQQKWYKDNREHLLKLGKDYHARPEIRERERRRHLLKKFGEVAFDVLARDEYLCQKCGSGKEIHIHHIDGDKENRDLENLIVFCNSCHQKLHAFIPKRLRRMIFEEWLAS